MALTARQGRDCLDESPGHARTACLRDDIQPEDLTRRGFPSVSSQTGDPLRTPIAFGKEQVGPIHPITPELLILVGLIGQLCREGCGGLFQGAYRTSLYTGQSLPSSTRTVISAMLHGVTLLRLRPHYRTKLMVTGSAGCPAGQGR
jgi:hypothetical protein